MRTLVGLPETGAKIDGVNIGFVRNVFVRRVQERLGVAGTDLDGVYGRGTARLVREWQANVGRAVTGNLTFEDWEALTGEEAPGLFERCLALTARFEGHGFEICKGDFDGALLTWGVIGFTMRHGEIQELIRQIDAASPRLVKDCFGPLEDSLRNGLTLTGQPATRWVEGISKSPGSASLLPAWTEAFAKLGADPAAQQAQINRARQKYWKRAERDANAHGLVSELGLALAFDTAVQNGGISGKESRRFENGVREGRAPDAHARRRLYAREVADGSLQRWVNDVWTRKSTIADGKGVVHGAAFNLRHWGLEDAAGADVVAAVAPATVAASEEERFLEFFRSLGVKHFTPDELLVMGASNNRRGARGFGKNTRPPSDLWENIRDAVRTLDRLREEIGRPIKILSAYRSPAYNTAIGGATASQHMRFTALDFTVSGGDPRALGRKLQAYRHQRVFTGGVGVYADKSFVHIDGRGENRDFGSTPLPPFSP